MYNSKPLLMFRHCDDNLNTFVLNLPQFCPLCGDDLESAATFKVPLFKVPNPLSDGHQNPFRIVIKPTAGNFMDNYTTEKNLHIGVTDSKGDVFHFNKNGLNRSTSSPFQSPSLSPSSPSTSEWNSCLAMMMCDQWGEERYKDNEYNCYTFVLSFLTELRLSNYLPTINSKEKFCEEFIYKNLIKCLNYISIIKEIEKNNYFINKKLT
ncbi:hypothetical protein HELRODRAFT_88263 [Helobdella robusta]|uniref:MKRN2 opposite strand protein n=1 Tax=Helobdella robusta TaxID=6412 RepID=T1G710_HELRO|nr:hypothetical protein HELRODRAFT_88263 [Helobdella robusta]ESN93727.1 hypothetical protein HELRODRAFT_88263 [Helobdella robusta]